MGKMNGRKLAIEQQKRYFIEVQRHFIRIRKPLTEFELQHLMLMVQKMVLSSVQFGIEAIRGYRKAVLKQMKKKPVNRKFNLLF